MLNLLVEGIVKPRCLKNAFLGYVDTRFGMLTALMSKIEITLDPLIKESIHTSTTALIGKSFEILTIKQDRSIQTTTFSKQLELSFMEFSVLNLQTNE